MQIQRQFLRKINEKYKNKQMRKEVPKKKKSKLEKYYYYYCSYSPTVGHTQLRLGQTRLY